MITTLVNNESEKDQNCSTRKSFHSEACLLHFSKMLHIVEKCQIFFSKIVKLTLEMYTAY